MKIKELCNDEMPREKLLSKGPGALSNCELLAIMIRTGDAKRNAIELGRQLLLDNGNRLTNLANITPAKMLQTNGIGPGKAATIAAAFELGRRFIAERSNDDIIIRGPEKVFHIMHPIIKGSMHEECWIIFLNKANKILSKEQMSVGGIDSTTFDSRLIIKKALEINATGIIIVHNHPSGNCTPGRSDILCTNKIKKALETFDLTLIDHIVMGENQYYSFSENSEFSI